MNTFLKWSRLRFLLQPAVKETQRDHVTGDRLRMTMYSNSVHRVPIRSKILLLGTKIVSSKTRDVSDTTRDVTDTIPKALLRGTSRPPLVVKTEVQIEYAHSIPV